MIGRRLLHSRLLRSQLQKSNNGLLATNLPRGYKIDMQMRYFGKESFEETLKKVQKDYSKAADTKEGGGSQGEASSKEGETDAKASGGVNPQDIARKVVDFTRTSYDFVQENLRIAWAEMTGQAKESTLERKFEQAATFKRASETPEEDEDGEPKEKGPSAIVVVEQAKSYWEQMAARLDAPFIRNILKGTAKFRKAAAETPVGQQAQKIGTNIKDKLDDAREFWETSQNPIVHTLSGVWDNLTGETEEGLTIAEIRKKDPKFDKEEWTAEVRKNLAPIVIKAHLVGDTKALRPWLAEGVYNKLSADIRLRKADGITFDPNILEIDENQVMMRFLEDGGPVIVVVYMVQQINCIRKKGEIVEGSEKDIRAKFYSMAFQQVFEDIDDTSAILKWKVVDYEFAGDIPYL